MTPWFWLLGVLLARIGLAMYAAGSVRSKNAASMVGRQVLDWSVAVLAFWLVGAAIALQRQTPVIGLSWRDLLGARDAMQMLGGLVLVSLVGAIPIGATAERAKWWPMLILSAVHAGVTVPLITNWTTFGWLRRIGFIELGGAATIHVVGATIAFIAILKIGPRDNKYHRDGSASMIPGHNLPLSMIGVLLAVTGILLYSTGPESNLAAVNALLAVAAAVMVSALYGVWQFGKIDLPLMAAGMLGGAVAISAAAGVVPQWGAVLLGGLTGFLVPTFLKLIDLNYHLDDVTGALTTHGTAGAYGLLAAGLFAPNGVWATIKQVLVQGLGLVVIIAVAGGVTLLILKLLGPRKALRVSDADEFDGLDLAEHDVAAYPDFQQNSIKSYHLREA